jgi:peptidoglycan/LPS O-acetylase OafA/YrhL
LRILSPYVPLTPELGFIAAVAVAVAGACVFSRLVEQPLLRWCRQITLPRRAIAAQGS